MHDQATNLRQQLDSVKQHPLAKTIAFVSGKGGVGKSNIALNFAIELQKRHKSVLLIDLDIGMGNIEVMLGLQAQYSIVDLLESHYRLQDIIQNGPNGLSFIAGGSGLLDIFSMNEQDFSFFYEEYSQAVRQFDYILFDMGAGINEWSVSFILAADECVVVTTPEPTAITDAYSMIKHLLQRNEKLPMSIIMNRVSEVRKGEKTAQQFQHIVEKFLNYNIVIRGVIPYDTQVTKAVIKQTPYLLLNERSRASQAIKRLVDLYTSTSDSVEQTANNPLSFIDKLKTFLRKR
ncbi:MAG TPA: MinD/ParA family protein [Cerasibacillus sp.]|uniref:MinD/ParA family protein n=1 Tax=Cerasibacillus sp. TaxID=2498711 RepID=UPI002F42E870